MTVAEYVAAQAARKAAAAAAAAAAIAKRCISKAPKLAKYWKKSVKEINDAIHKVKNKHRGGGPAGQRNPNVTCDPHTGEIYPQLKDGSIGDSIGNIWDFLSP